MCATNEGPGKSVWKHRVALFVADGNLFSTINQCSRSSIGWHPGYIFFCKPLAPFWHSSPILAPWLHFSVGFLVVLGPLEISAEKCSQGAKMGLECQNGARGLQKKCSQGANFRLSFNWTS